MKLLKVLKANLRKDRVKTAASSAQAPYAGPDLAVFDEIMRENRRRREEAAAADGTNACCAPLPAAS